MKKMFFTAMAFVAFSTVSLAKDKKEEKKGTVKEETVKSANLVKPQPCMSVYVDNYEMIIELGGTNQEASEFAAGAYGCCIGSC